MVLAMDYQEYAQSRFNAHAIHVSDKDDRTGYGFVMRTLFIGQGSNLGLNAADLEIVKVAGLPDSAAIMAPYMEQLDESKDASAVDLAAIFESGIAAEDENQEAFYRKLLTQLSEEGQAKVERAYEKVSGTITINRIDYSGIAADLPELFTLMIQNAVKKYRNRSGGFGIGEGNE